MTLINTQILILGRAKVTDFEQQAKLLEKKSRKQLPHVVVDFFQGF